MTLSESQQIFSKLVADLIHEIYRNGDALSLGEVYRSPVQAWVNAQPAGTILIARNGPMEKAYVDAVGGVGVLASAHRNRLAVDIHLYKNHNLTSKVEDYLPYGVWWEKQNSSCRWGGKFKRVDPFHFSFEWMGVM